VNNWIGRRRVRRSLRRQAGAETVELALTLVLFFFIVFTILDFSLAAYNKGAVVTASRIGARQGSLFWIDPNNYDRTAPTANVRIKQTMISSAVSPFLSLVMRQPGDSNSQEERVFDENFDPDNDDPPDALTSSDVVCCPGGSGCTVEVCASRADVVIDLNYVYQGFTAVPWIPSLKLSGSAGTRTEADL